jgi:hypothetical protein
MSDLILLGEAPGDGDEPPTGRSWTRLAELAGVQDVRQLGRPANLAGYWPDYKTKKRGIPPGRLKRLAQEYPLKGRVLLLGRRVSTAFGLKGPYLRWAEMAGAQVAIFPSPSPINRYWNDSKKLEGARAFLKALAMEGGVEFTAISTQTTPQPDQPRFVGKPWDRHPDERSGAYGAFQVYLELGPRRTIRAVREALGRLESYDNHLRMLRKKHSWDERTRAWDSEELQRALNRRGEQRDMARRVLFEASMEFAVFIVELAKGKVDADPTKAKPSTRLQAALRGLELCGLVPPKRIEITQKTEIDVSKAAKAVQRLGIEDIRTMLERATVH